MSENRRVKANKSWGDQVIGEVSAVVGIRNALRIYQLHATGSQGPTEPWTKEIKSWLMTRTVNRGKTIEEEKNHENEASFR